MDPRPSSPVAVELHSLDVPPRTLGLRDAVAIVVGSIIGSGIFVKEGTIATEVKSFGPIMGVWLIVGVVTWCGVLAIGELAAMMPQAGGPYVYLKAAYGRLPAFLWGWTEFWIIRTAALGSLACAVVLYLEELIPKPSPTSADALSHGTKGVIAAGIIVVLAWVNARGTRWGANVQNATTFIKTGFLATLIVAPWLMGRADAQNLSPLQPERLDFDFWKAIGLAMIAVKWPYDGWVNLGFIAGEIKQPQRNVPMALSLGMAAIVGLYLAATLSYHLVLPFEEVKDAKRIASDVSRSLFGPAGAMIAALGVMISALGAANSNMLTVPRIYFAMARDGLLPKAMGRLHSVYVTPANCIVMQAVWAIVMLAVVFTWTAKSKRGVGDAFDQLTDFVIFGGELFYAMTVAAVFVLRRKLPHVERPYRTWGYPVTPLLYLAATAAVLASLFQKRPHDTAFGFVLIAAGIPYYLWASRRKPSVGDAASVPE